MILCTKLILKAHACSYGRINQCRLDFRPCNKTDRAKRFRNGLPDIPLLSRSNFLFNCLLAIVENACAAQLLVLFYHFKPSKTQHTRYPGLVSRSPMRKKFSSLSYIILVLQPIPTVFKKSYYCPHKKRQSQRSPPHKRRPPTE